MNRSSNAATHRWDPSSRENNGSRCCKHFRTSLRSVPPAGSNDLRIGQVDFSVALSGSFRAFDWRGDLQSPRTMSGQWQADSLHSLAQHGQRRIGVRCPLQMLEARSPRGIRHWHTRPRTNGRRVTTKVRATGSFAGHCGGTPRNHDRWSKPGRRRASPTSAPGRHQPDSWEYHGNGE